MNYDFAKNLSILEEAREKSKTLQDLQRVRTRFIAYQFQASLTDRDADYIRGLIHEAITLMHLFERSEKHLFLDAYFMVIQGALANATVYTAEKKQNSDLSAQVYRRLGDYFYEVGNHIQADYWYREANDQLDQPNPEYLAPMARQMALNGMLKQSQEIFKKILKKTPAKPGKQEWRTKIVSSGVLMKYAEALVAGKNLDEAKKHMLAAKRLSESLDAQAYRQRIIQWHRLNRKLKLFPFASRR